MARRTLANHRRGEQRRFDLTARLSVDLYSDLRSADPFPESDMPAIGAAFRALPEGDRELLGLISWEGLDHGQIATVLGVSRNTVRVRLHRARRRFARQLDHHGLTSEGENS